MKRKLIMTLLIIGILVLTACENSNHDASNEKETETANQMDETMANQSEEEIDYRIVSTTVALVEIMDKLEIELAAVPTSYKALPARYEGLPEVGNGMSPDLEQIMVMQPTEIMSVSTLKADLEEKLSTLDTEVVYYNLESLDGMLQEIKQLGEKYNRQEQAANLVKIYEDKQTEIIKQRGDEVGPSVLILLGVPGSYLIATDKSYIGDLVAKSGGVNVFSDEAVEYISVNTEFLQEKNPDIILRAAHGLPDEVVEMFDEEFQTNDIWKHFSAVQNDRVYDLEEALFGTTANLAAIEAFDELLEMLYPVE